LSRKLLSKIQFPIDWIEYRISIEEQYQVRRTRKMDFLKNLLGSDEHKRQIMGRFMQNGCHHGGDHDDDHDDHHHPQYPTNTYPQNPTNPAAFLPGIVCRNCSTTTVQSARFCHGCGAAIEMILNCASCGSKLPAKALFCPQCGYKSG
jgi:hypothetical protein